MASAWPSKRIGGRAAPISVGENHSNLYDGVLGSIHLMGSTDRVLCRLRLGCHFKN